MHVWGKSGIEDAYYWRVAIAEKGGQRITAGYIHYSSIEYLYS